MKNYILQEAIDSGFSPVQYISDFKKLLNNCKLTKFKSTSANDQFYSAFFCNQVDNELTYDQWNQIYTGLLNDSVFTNSLVLFIALYQPKTYTGMFKPIITLIESELSTMTTTQIRYLSGVKAFIRYLQTQFDSIGTMVQMQTQDHGAVVFITTINGVLTTDLLYINSLIQRSIDSNYDKDDIMCINTPIGEDAVEILNLIENASTWIADHTQEYLTEGIVNATKEKAQELYVASQKANRSFDELVMKRVQKARNNRRNRKHAEMVGEALRINHELKKLLASIGIGMINPAIGVLTWVTSTVIDRETDQRDRKILIGQLKDELEIVEEKISQAERNGDDKGKVELIRLRQKLQHEYERINHYRFDSSRLNH